VTLHYRTAPGAHACGAADVFTLEIVPPYPRGYNDGRQSAADRSGILVTILVADTTSAEVRSRTAPVGAIARCRCSRTQ
jgi:hypothetical protein